MRSCPYAGGVTRPTTDRRRGRRRPGPGVVFACLLAAASACSEPESLAARRGRILARDVEEARWRHRAVLLFDASDDDRDSALQRELVHAGRARLTDGSVEVFRVPAGDQGAALRAQMGVDEGNFRVVVLERDGSERARFARPALVDDLLSVLDTPATRP